MSLDVVFIGFLAYSWTGLFVQVQVLSGAPLQEAHPHQRLRRGGALENLLVRQSGKTNPGGVH